MRKNNSIVAIIVGFSFLLAACLSTQPESVKLTPTEGEAAPTLTAPPNPSRTPTRTNRPPTGTLVPTEEPSPTITPTPTVTATPAHPLTIEYLRQQDFSASEIVIEEVLERGANYDRYYVSYQSEGLTIYALMTVPFGDPPDSGWPVIIFNHGYIPPDIYRTTERYIAYVDSIAQHGYIVLRSDYRGHDRSEGEANGAYGSPDYTVDVLNAVAAMKAYPDADPDRIGMWGHSMGGYITLRSMVVNADIKAGVIWAGVVGPYPNLFDREDFNLFATPRAEFPGRGRWRLDLFQTFGDPEENPELWAALSANSYLEDLSGPIQLHHGTADADVPFSVSQLLYDQIDAVEGEVEFYGYPGDDHNIGVAFSVAMTRSIEFFDRYVKGNE